MNPPSSVRVHIDVVSQQLGDEVVLLNLKTGVYWGLNKTGAAFWQEIEKDGDVQRVLAALQERYDASEPQIAQAVRELVAQLLKEGLLVVDGQGV
jgi:hypothetical protein